MVSNVRRTSLATHAASLHGHPCFSGCSRRSLVQLERHGCCIALAPGAVLQPRQPTRWVYFVLSGTLSIDAGSEAWLVGPGGTVGLQAAFGDNTPTLAIETATTAVAYIIGGKELRAVAVAIPPILERIATSLARHAT
jgi:CRP-like cAMP-binding protein